jgi:hypothetical protein
VGQDGDASSDEESDDDDDAPPRKRRRRKMKKKIVDKRKRKLTPATVLDRDDIFALRQLNLCDDFFWFKRQIKHYEGLHKELTDWCRVLCVVGFNSGKYDINVIRKHLLPILQADHDANRKPGDDRKDSNHSISIIKNGNCYKMIKTNVSGLL